jgi:Glycosyltransferase Family 4
VSDERIRIRLRDLIQENPLDEDDELKGYALSTLWPEYLSVTELLQSLTPEKNGNLIGSYAYFTSELELPQLTETEAQEVLGWVSVVALSDEERSRIFSRAIPKFLDRVWESSDKPAVLHCLAQFFLRSFSSAQFHILQDVANDFLLRVSHFGERRRLLVEEIVQCSTTENWSWLAFAFPVPLVNLQDLPWLLDRILSPSASFPEQAAAQLILAIVPKDKLDELEAVWQAAEVSSLLAIGLTSIFSCELTSSISKWQREDYQRTKAKQALREKERFDALSALENRLREVESKDSFGWWELNLAFFADDRGYLSQEFHSDLTSTNLWEVIPETMQDRVLATAVRYLTENKLQSVAWLGTNTFHRPSAAGYRALRLLLEHAHENFIRLSSADWRNWCACIFLSFNENTEGQKTAATIASKAYEFAPERVMRSIARILFKSSSEYDARHAVSLLDQCFDEKLGNFLWAASRKLGSGKVREALIGYLAKKSHQQLVVALLKDLESEVGAISSIYSEEEFVVGVSCLLQNNPSVMWPIFAHFRAKNQSIALKIVRSFDYESAFIPEMAEMDLADFYIWTYREMPPQPDNRTAGARWAGPDEHIDHLRHAALRRLTTIGTSLAVAALKRIAAELTELPWLKYHVLDARRAFDATTWRLREPSEVIAAIALYAPTQPPRSTKAALADLADKSSISLKGVEQALHGMSPITIEQTIPFPPEFPPIVPRRILAVATEWRSGHGGVSTLNRELCVALAKLGHEVVCLVLDATGDEIHHARAANVQLITPRTDAMPSLSDVTRLLLFSRRSIEGFEPELVIGHDHITGSAARHIAHDGYGVPYVHFIHTLPEETGRHKTRGPQSVLKGAIKAQIQLDQCKSAQLVVAIGPKILQHVVGRLSRANMPVVEMRPGLNKELLTHVVDLSKPRRVDCLLVARFEDPVLKGAPLACRVISKVNLRWPGKPWTRPHLVMRGFTEKGVNKEIEQSMASRMLRHM